MDFEEDKFNVAVHECGYVKLINYMGSDEFIVDTARISYDRRGKTEDRNLLRYLLRHRHTSPFEMGEMVFEVKMPIFVARQWVRHRTASLNEVSARYTQLPAEMFIPEVFSVQSTANKQGRADDAATDYTAAVEECHHEAYNLYEDMLESGVSRELARGVLPLNIYTKFVWKMDLHNLMHFLNLRLDPHAQKEIRDYAQVIEKMMANVFPMTYEAFVDYIRDSYNCSRMEIDVIKQLLIRSRMQDYRNWQAFSANVVDACRDLGMSQREIDEFMITFGIKYD